MKKKNPLIAKRIRTLIDFIEIHMKSSICMLDTHELVYGWHILAYELAYEIKMNDHVR